MKVHVLISGIAAFAALIGYSVDAAAQIKGKVLFEGTPLKRSAIKMTQDAVCETLHDKPVGTQKVIFNKASGTLGYVFVYVKQGLEGKEFPVPETPVKLNQEGCVYKPHVFGVMMNQTVEIWNSDNTTHNVHVLAKTNRELNTGMRGRDEPWKKDRRFDQREVMVPIKCDVHPWMNAYMAVMEHPFYDVTAGEGTFELGGSDNTLPPGKYVIEAWHEYYGILTQEVTLGAGETKEIAFKYTEDMGL